MSLFAVRHFKNVVPTVIYAPNKYLVYVCDTGTWSLNGLKQVGLLTLIFEIYRVFLLAYYTISNKKCFFYECASGIFFISKLTSIQIKNDGNVRKSSNL